LIKSDYRNSFKKGAEGVLEVGGCVKTHSLKVSGTE
jgi:hypothetical protein